MTDEKLLAAAKRVLAGLYEMDDDEIRAQATKHGGGGELSIEQAEDFIALRNAVAQAERKDQ